jgi:hypothetical protein
MKHLASVQRYGGVHGIGNLRLRSWENLWAAAFALETSSVGSVLFESRRSGRFFPSLPEKIFGFYIQPFSGIFPIFGNG